MSKKVIPPIIDLISWLIYIFLFYIISRFGDTILEYYKNNIGQLAGFYIGVHRIVGYDDLLLFSWFARPILGALIIYYIDKYFDKIKKWPLLIIIIIVAILGIFMGKIFLYSSPMVDILKTILD